MKAAVYYGPGDVRIEDVREPEPPGPAEVVIQVKMGSLCGTDASQYKAATMVPLDGPLCWLHQISVQEKALWWLLGTSVRKNRHLKNNLTSLLAKGCERSVK